MNSAPTAPHAIDVVTPVRDVDWFLMEAVQSALGQVDVDCHVVVVDDASRVPIRLPPAVLASGRVGLIRSERHLGIGGARNLGLSVGCADLVAFLDADDVWPADRSRALVAALGDRHTYASGRVDHFADATADPSFRIPDPGQHAVLPGSTVIRRRAIEDLGGFSEELVLGDFVDLMARGMSAGWTGGRTETVVLRRRVHRDHASRMPASNSAGYLRVVRDQLQRARESGR